MEDEFWKIKSIFLVPESHSTRWDYGGRQNKNSDLQMSHPNAKNSGSKREKGEKRHKRAEKNDYLHMNVTRDSDL